MEQKKRTRYFLALLLLLTIAIAAGCGGGGGTPPAGSTNRRVGQLHMGQCDMGTVGLRIVNCKLWIEKSEIRNAKSEI